MSESVDALKSGDLRKQLTALRDLLADDLKTSGPRERPALAKQYRDTVERLDRLPGGEEKSRLDHIAESVPADELAPRRANRKPGAKA